MTLREFSRANVEEPLIKSAHVGLNQRFLNREKEKNAALRRFAGMAALLAALLPGMGQARADTWQHTATSRISTEYETNPAMTPVSQGGMWRALFEPGYTLTRTDGANEWRTGLTFQVARSSNTALSLNREDPSVFMNWQRRSDAGEFGMSARYDEAATRATESGMTGPVAVDGTRASRSLSANWNKQMDERDTFAINGAYTSISYKGGTYVDYATRSGGMRLTRDWNETVAPFVSLSYTDQTPSGGGVSSSRTSATLGSGLKISERLDCTVQADKSREGNGGGSMQYMVSASYSGQMNRVAVSAGRQASTSGLGGFITSDHASADLSRDLSERSRAGVNLAWRKNRSVSDEATLTLDTWLQLDVNEAWAARARYQRRERELGGMNASSNLAGFSLVYTRSNF